jgi:protein O-GlcNAc transferase
MSERSPAVLAIVDDIRVCCPDDMRLMTPYVLREQNDWFEDEIRFFRLLTRPDTVFIDIGANYGLYSLSVARRGARQIWSYEPCAETARYLARSIAINGFSSIHLRQQALSELPGIGRLLNSENPELNALVAADDERGEAVELTSLDEEWARHGWSAVDLVKIDAEGHELKVLAGGERFFREQSPLVMMEIKAGASLDLGPARRLIEWGYQCYRLVPGLSALVPQSLDDRIDGFQLNVFCCKPDRAAMLAARGLLAFGGSNAFSIPAGGWHDFLLSLPATGRQVQAWAQQVERNPQQEWSAYREALDAYAVAASDSSDIERRSFALQTSFRLLDGLVRKHANLPRLISYARVAADLGHRETAVQALNLILKSIQARQAEIGGSEPFLPPSANLAHTDSGGRLVEWTISSLLDAYEHLRSYSSYFSRPEITLGIANDMRGLGFLTPGVARRAAAVQARSSVVRSSDSAPSGTAGPVASLLNQARECQRSSDLRGAADLCEQALRLDPDNAQTLHLAGVVAFQSGDYERARDFLGRALRKGNANPPVLNDLGLVQAELGQSEEAIASFREALRLQPDFVAAWANLGDVFLNAGRYQDAIQSYEQALSLQPRLVAVQHSRAWALLQLDRDEEAQAGFERVLELQPDHIDAHLNLGVMMLRRNRFEEAIAINRRALALRSDLFLAHFNIGFASLGLGRTAEALASYERAIAVDPTRPDAYYNMGCILLERGRAEEACACFQRALDNDPHHALAWLNLGVSWQNSGEHERAVRYFEEARRNAPDSPVVWSTVLLSLNYRELSGDEVYAAHRSYGERVEAPLRGGWKRPEPDRTPGRRLRIGYVSPDFRRHSVAYFMEPVLSHHDREGFEIYAYYCGAKRDDVTERLQALTDAWVDCHAWSDERLAERIRADGIDILVDLAGHTRDNRLLVFARRPAPVQVTWLGYPATTGLESMDWRLCSEETDPEGSERWHSERLYRLRSLWCFRPRGDEEPPRMQETPSLQRGGEVWFGSMNNLAKVSAETVRTWSRILREVPNSRLVMTNVPEGEARRRVAERFGREGIGEERLLLHGRLPDGEYRAVLDGVDLALDPFPYNGTTTSCETLWRGIPLVTLKGDRSVSRSGYALLKAVGLEELVSADEEGYVRLAVELARDSERLSRLRRELPERFAGSVLRDEEGFVRDLEAAYRSMWDEALHRV